MRPAVSKDGNLIVFVKEANGIPQIYILDRGMQPEPTYYISGKVTGSLGDPLALVTIKDNNGNTVQTDRDGYFFLSGITPGQVSISLQKEGFNFLPSGASSIVATDIEDKNFIYQYNKVIEEARKDIGMPYDHRCENGPACQGEFHGYAAGQCTDLVLDAFTWGADFNIKLALEQDSLAHPEHFYQSRNARDAFDMWRYFMYSEQMLSNSEPYQPGDLVFFDWSEDGEIDHVALVSQVNGIHQPTWMVDASGVIASNPSGLASELPWEPFHERSVRGHARWNGAYESPVLEPPRGEFFQVGLGSANANLNLLSDQGRRLGLMESNMPGGSFFDLIWEQNLSVENPLKEGNYSQKGANYYVIISNPTDEVIPYYFVVQTVQDGKVENAFKLTDRLQPAEIKYLPIKLYTEGSILDFEFITRSRKSGGKIIR
jgi:hypothetical protein